MNGGGTTPGGETTPCDLSNPAASAQYAQQPTSTQVRSLVELTGHVKEYHTTPFLTGIPGTPRSISTSVPGSKYCQEQTDWSPTLSMQHFVLR